MLCSLKNINLSYGNNILFNGASLTISYNDRIGLLGLNGRGKTTLFKILEGEVIPDPSTPPFQFDKSKGLGKLDLPFSVFYVPQEFIEPQTPDQPIKDYLYNFYPRLKELVERRLYEEIENIKGWDIIQGFESYLKFFGFNDLNLPVQNLSGGEQKKVLLSLGFSSTASLILWDEPTNHLDMETIKVFEDQILQTDKTLMIVSHDRYLLTKLTNKIFHLQDGKIKSFNGSYTDYLEFLNQQETERKRLLERLRNTLRRETAWMRQGIKARGTRSKKRVESYHSLQEKVSTIKNQAKKELIATISSSERKTKKLLELKDVTFGYGENILFNKINLLVGRKNKIGLLGANGVGKSTLTQLIAGEIKAQEGEVSSALQLNIKCFSQKREELDPNLTPYQLLGDGSDFIYLPNGKQKHVISYLKQFIFTSNDIHRPISSFSGGEKNRLQLSLNLKEAADLWIFDEPTNDLDLETLAIFEEKLQDFDGALILISHDRAFLSAVTNKIWLIVDKEIEVFEGGYSQVETYLEAIDLENQLHLEAQVNKEKEPESQKESKESNKNSPPRAKKLSYKEKLRLEELKKLILEKEKHIITIEEKVLKFDFSNMDQDSSLLYNKLTKEKEELEEALLSHYEEQEQLNL